MHLIFHFHNFEQTLLLGSETNVLSLGAAGIPVVGQAAVGAAGAAVATVLGILI